MNINFPPPGGASLRSLLSQWLAWTIFQRHTTRWHGALARLLRGARSTRAMILLQAALASWQQYTLRTLGLDPFRTEEPAMIGLKNRTVITCDYLKLVNFCA